MQQARGGGEGGKKLHCFVNFFVVGELYAGADSERGDETGGGRQKYD